MKYLKIVSIILISAGIVSVIAAFIWGWVDPQTLAPLVPFFIGIWLFVIGLLGLIIFWVYLLVLELKRRERPQGQEKKQGRRQSKDARTTRSRDNKE